MKSTLIILLLMSATWTATAQTATPVLSSLQATDVVDGSTGKIGRLFLDFSVSDPAGLSKVEIEMSNADTSSGNSARVLGVVTHDNITVLDLGTYTVSFDGHRIQFFLDVTTHYAKILIIGYDKQGSKTVPLGLDREK